jgi:hypothetical protein
VGLGKREEQQRERAKPEVLSGGCLSFHGASGNVWTHSWFSLLSQAQVVGAAKFSPRGSSRPGVSLMVTVLLWSEPWQCI